MEVMARNSYKSYYEISTTRFPSEYWHSNIIKVTRSVLKEHNVREPVLDLGCGDGVRSRLILGDHLEIHGVDIDTKMLEFAKKRLNKVYHHNIEENLDEILDNRRFNTILLIESLEHVQNPEKVLQNVARLLNDEGLLLVVVPLETPLFRIIWWIWTRTYGAIWREAHLYKFNSADQLLSMLKKYFMIVEHRTTNFGCILVVLCKKISNKL
ncbi:MAG: class I SAM-dependent methyltransferase [Thaumarchaeota archaeon]|nr:class I SAM-dependent methyltransferase [Candidatus Calditenuaceae archaeon]